MEGVILSVRSFIRSLAPYGECDRGWPDGRTDDQRQERSALASSVERLEKRQTFNRTPLTVFGAATVNGSHCSPLACAASLRANNAASRH